MKNRETFMEAAYVKFGAAGTEVKAKALIEFAESKGFARKDYAWMFAEENKVGWGVYKLPGQVKDRKPRTVTAKPVASPRVSAEAPQMIAQVIPMRPVAFDPNAHCQYSHAEVPARDKHFVPFGEYRDIETIIKSGRFFPVFISGMSGNGKTFSVEQACARVGRPMIRVQMSRETDEDDLIGGFRLINGETKFLKGPVLRAMESGALLLIDEADRADPGKVMCIQGVLEGKPYYVKKTGEVIHPQPGFTVIVTANSKGKGSDDGRYVAATILDDAWLERFPVCIEQNYPTASVETAILRSYLKEGLGRDLDSDQEGFVAHLVAWADIIRRTFNEGAIDEVISTRRLVHIVKTYVLFTDKMRAITLCTSRFNEDTKAAFLELYRKVDPTINPVEPAPQTATDLSEIPF